MIGDKQDLKEYIGYSDNGKVYPMYIIHPYKDCNIDCSVCYIRHSDSYCAFDYGEVMSVEAVEKFASACARRHGCLYTGAGEPFLKWDEFTKPILIPTVKKCGAKLVISTNGLWGNNDRIIDEVIELQPDVITFSVDFIHKVPLENINHAIERLSDNSVKTMLYMAQITDDEHPLGHIKPLHFDDMLVMEYNIGKNGHGQHGMPDQRLIFHDKLGNPMLL